MSTEETQRSTKATSARKIEANRRNAQLSTGPKTEEGKAKSGQNSITHGIFVTKFLNGATPEAAAEIQELSAGLQEHYQPKGILEEILVQKIVVETARYGRVLALEQPEPGRNTAYLVHCLDKIMRYTTSTSRALYHAIQELERVQAVRKARESAALSTGGEAAAGIAESNKGQPTTHVVSDTVTDGTKPANSDGAREEE